jgi:hypothetical protein
MWIYVSIYIKDEEPRIKGPRVTVGAVTDFDTYNLD